MSGFLSTARAIEPLALAAGEFHAPVADVGPVTVGAFADEAVGVGDLRRLDHLFVRGAALAHADVVFDGVVEKHGVLRHDAHMGAHALLRESRSEMPSMSISPAEGS